MDKQVHIQGRAGTTYIEVNDNQDSVYVDMTTQDGLVLGEVFDVANSVVQIRGHAGAYSDNSDYCTWTVVGTITINGSNVHAVAADNSTERTQTDTAPSEKFLYQLTVVSVSGTNKATLQVENTQANPTTYDYNAAAQIDYVVIKQAP